MSTAFGLLAIAFVGWTATTLLALFVPERGFQTGFFGHFMAFLILGFVLFMPWFVGSAFIIDHTMTNEQKFSGMDDCDVAEEPVPLGEASGGNGSCTISAQVPVVYFATGIGMYILSWVGSRSLIAIWPSSEGTAPTNNTVTIKNHGRYK